MASIPFVASTAFGERLFVGLQKVLAAANVPVQLVKTEAKFAPAGAKYLLAEPLSLAMTGELANKYGLSSKVTKGPASKWYPESIYPTLNLEVVQNLYSHSNPAFASGGMGAIPTKAVTVKDEAGVKLMEIQKDMERTIAGFFREEASKSMQSTMRLAFVRAAKAKADRKNVMVVTKPHGDTYDDLLAQVAKSEADGKADELRASSIAVEPAPVGAAWPRMVMFPEAIQQVVCPPNAVGDQMVALFIGMAGGTGMVAQQLVGDAVVYTCANAEGSENPAGALLAACDLLADLGHSAEAQKLSAAVGKAFTAKIMTNELPGGKVNFDEFIEAVAKNC